MANSCLRGCAQSHLWGGRRRSLSPTPFPRLACFLLLFIILLIGVTFIEVFLRDLAWCHRYGFWSQAAWIQIPTSSPAGAVLAKALGLAFPGSVSSAVKGNSDHNSPVVRTQNGGREDYSAVKTLVAPAPDLGLSLSHCSRWFTTVTPVPGILMLSLASTGTRHEHGPHTYDTCMHLYKHLKLNTNAKSFLKNFFFIIEFFCTA